MTATTERLARWHRARDRFRQFAAVGDSITGGTGGRRAVAAGVTRGWVDQIRDMLAAESGTRPGYGFRGLWLDDEWAHDGDWQKTGPKDAFDVAPFGRGLYSSGEAIDGLTWTKPADFEVAAVDIVSFAMPGAGAWQYRVDDGPWHSAPAISAPERGLRRHPVLAPVHAAVEVRGYDGVAPCVAAIAGLIPHAAVPPASSGTIVHNLGCAFDSLAKFVRVSAGDPLALLDDLCPDLVSVEFSNDVMLGQPDRFSAQLGSFVERVQPYADVLVIVPFEQQPRELQRATCGTGNRRDREMQAVYRAATHEVARRQGCTILDLYDEWAAAVGPGWDAANAHGLMYDRLHPSQTGHDDIAARVARLLGPGHGAVEPTSMSVAEGASARGGTG